VLTRESTTDAVLESFPLGLPTYEKIFITPPGIEKRRSPAILITYLLLNKWQGS
jgi:hypothetical protein